MQETFFRGNFYIYFLFPCISCLFIVLLLGKHKPKLQAGYKGTEFGLKSITFPPSFCSKRGWVQVVPLGRTGAGQGKTACPTTLI